MKRKKWTGAALCVVLVLLTACGVAGQTAENDAADMAMETGDANETEETAETGPVDSDVNRTESTGAADSSGQTGVAGGQPGDGTLRPGRRLERSAALRKAEDAHGNTN